MPDAFALSLLLVLVSPAVGSFLGVLIDRLPREQSAVYPRSTCRSCATSLGWKDLVPILSFALSRGRCRYCDAAIPPWLLYTEIVAIGAAMIALIIDPAPAAAGLIALVLWLLWTLTLSDLLHFRLPDPLTGGLLLAALAWALREGNFALSLLGTLLGAGSFLALRVGYRSLRGREGLGLGDVKLMAGLGALIGPQDLPLMVLFAALLALAAAALSKDGWHPARPLPFGAALSAAGALVWLWSLMHN